MRKGGKADGRNGGVTIIRKEEVTGGESHGGAWKVAYADFVTAMMAFFLLMWLLNATTEDQRKGLADYFSPTNLLSHASSGTGQPFGGHTAFDQGAMVSDRGAVQVVVGKRPVVEDPQDEEADTPLLADRHGAAAETGPAGKTDAATQGAAQAERAPAVAVSRPGQGPAAASVAAGSLGAAGPMGAAAAGRSAGNGSAGAARAEGEKVAVPVAARAAGQASSGASGAAEQQSHEKQAFEQAAAQIRQAVRGDPALVELSHQLAIDITPEGLRVQLLDEDRRPMFATGSAAPNDRARLLLAKVAPVLMRLTEDIAVVGHTDAAPYVGTGKTNWELSTERANATRRLLTDAGLPEVRVSRVTGLADRDPLIPADPLAAANRRIAIIVLRSPNKPAAPAGVAAPAASQSAVPAGAASVSVPVPASAGAASAGVSSVVAPAAASGAAVGGRSTAPPAVAPARPFASPPVAAPVPASLPAVAPISASRPMAAPVPSSPPVAAPVPATAPLAAPVPASLPVAAPVPASSPVATPVPASLPVAAPVPASVLPVGPPAEPSPDPSGPPPAPSFAPSFVPSLAPSVSR